jgi:hypothetical protein
MVYSEFCSEKLSGYKINGPAHAYVDQNLQIQSPGSDLQEGTVEINQSYTPIYAYFTPSLPPYRSFSFKEAELMQAMNEANNSHNAWKKMKEQLHQVSSKYFNC